MRNERQIEPSGEFRARVMRAVQGRSGSGWSHAPVWRVAWPVIAVGSVIVALLIA